MARPYLAILCVVIALRWSASVACAAPVTIGVGNVSIAPNGIGQIDVSISGAGDLLSFLGYELRITPVGGTSSQLHFLEDQEALMLDPSYLFAGNSDALSDALDSSFGTVSTSFLPDDTFVGGDAAINFGDIALQGSKLLMRLLVEHDAGPADPATTVGHSFNVALVPPNGDSAAFLMGSSNTGIATAAFTGVPFASSSGTVTVIPEPSSALLVAIGMAFLIAGRRILS